MFHLDQTGPAWAGVNHLRQVERPGRQDNSCLWLQTCGLLNKNALFRNSLYRKTEKSETHSRLKLRQGGLKLRCDQLKWLSFHIKLLVSTATKSDVSFEGGAITEGEGGHISHLMTWGKVSVGRLNKDISNREVKSRGFSSPSCKHTRSCSDKQPVSGSMV